RRGARCSRRLRGLRHGHAGAMRRKRLDDGEALGEPAHALRHTLRAYGFLRITAHIDRSPAETDSGLNTCSIFEQNGRSVNEPCTIPGRFHAGSGDAHRTRSFFTRL